MSARAVAPMADRRLFGIGLMLAAYLCFTGIDTCAKWLVQSGLPPMEVAFVRYAAHLVIATALLAPGAGLRLFATRAIGLEALRALFLLGSTVLNFFAVQYLPLTLTVTIFFTVPLWVCALSVPFLGEKVGLRRWSAIFVGFGGVLAAMQPWSAEAHPAMLLSLGAACCASFYAITTRKLAGIDSSATQQFYAAGLATLALAPVATIGWQWPALPIDWVAFALIGFFGWLGHQFLTVAHRYAPASTLAPFIYAQMFFMATSSYLIFHDPIKRQTLVGGAIILASGLYIWMRERKLDGAGPSHQSPR
ncbi:MAG: DMT family transporter [Neomegalonema sp.]|nr:DMT family transporter [Neomegalonema sp.]